MTARSATAVLARTEARLFLREPGTLLLALLLPTVLLVGLGAVPALREPSAAFGGQAFLTGYTPSLLGWSLAFLALQTMPANLVAYREKGILRRLAITPVRPAVVLQVQLLLNVVTAAIAMVLVVVVAVGVFGSSPPRHPLAFAAAFVIGSASMFALGLLIAALAPRAKAAAALGTLGLLVTQFFGGLYLPRFLLPEVIVRIGEFVPPGIGAFQSAWTGDGATPVQLTVLSAVAVVATVAAVRYFRWE
ncbi:ABC transporter permease [Pseudonocardia thermophila]|uniref:ABC transporter permease n=1 Tax=Pseudonocardia thermophila TaxID=1848 RepID=UPI00248F0342|nr:ABC transporter permease [Pseudonocardia thermophila]